MRLIPSRGINGLPGSVEHGLAGRRDEIHVEERDIIVAGVALGADEPRICVDREPIGCQKLADAEVVGHLRETPRIRPAAPAPARAAVVGRLVRIVEADGSVSNDEYERGQAILNADIFKDAAHNIRHLAHRESRMRPHWRRFFLSIQLQAGL